LGNENLKYVTQSCIWARAEHIADTFLSLFSVVDPDPDSIRCLDPDPDLQSGSGKIDRKI
jgi:hypothetical protein